MLPFNQNSLPCVLHSDVRDRAVVKNYAGGFREFDTFEDDFGAVFYYHF